MGLFMSKRKKKSKNNFFPWMEEENLTISSTTNNKIVTDAGWEIISFDEACKYFSPEEIREWYSSYWSGADITNLFAELEVDIDLENEEALDKFLDTYDWTPKKVNVVVAKAVYESNAWTRVLTISTPEFEEYNFENHEEQAILLGVQMRKHLGLDILVINDCKNAVRRVRRQYPTIGWQPRKCVRAAHNLKISQATKVYNEQVWESEWFEEEEDWDF